MDEDVRPVGVELTARNDQYDAAMRQSAAETQGLESGIDRVTQKLDALAKGAGKKLVLIGAADVALLTGAAAAAGSLESNMSALDAQSQATQRTMSQGKRVYGEYRDSVASLRKEFPMTTSGAAELINTISRLGDSSRPIDEVARSFTRLSGATGEGPAQLAAGVLTLSRQMGNGTRDVEAYNNTILRLSASTGQGAGSLVSFASTLAPASRQLKITQTDLLGISTAFARSGQDGNLAANAFNKMANDISVAIQTNSPELKTYADLIGMTTDQLRSSNKTDVITQVFESLNREGPDAIRTLQRLGFEGQRNMRAIQGVSQMQGGIAGAVRDARGGFAEGGGDGSTLQRASDAAFNGLSDQTRKQTEALKKNAEAFGAPFALVGTKFLEGTTALTNAAGELIDGPLGKIGMVAAGAIGPVALLAGSLLLMAKSMMTLASIRFIAGSGVAGLLSGMGAGGKTTRNTAASIAAGRGNFLTRNMFSGGNALGRTINDSRLAGSQARVTGMGPGALSRFAALPLRGYAAGMSMLGTSYAPLQQRGFNDITRRNNFFQSTTMGQAIAGSALGRSGGALREGWGRGTDTLRQRDFARLGAVPIGQGAADRATLARLGGQDLRSAAGGREAAAATRNMVGFNRALGQAASSTAKFTGTLASAAAGTARMGAGAVGKIGAATGMGPLGIGLLAVAGGSALYNKNKDVDRSADYKDYDSYLSRYANDAGVSVASRSYTRANELEERTKDNKPSTMSDVLQVTAADRQIANDPARKSTDKRIKGGMSEENLLQLLAPDYAGMESIPPEMLQSLKYDLIDEKGADAAKRVISQLQGRGKKNGGNTAGNVDFDPGAMFEDAASGKTSQGTALNNMLRAVESRANNAAADSSSPDKAYDTTMRSNYLKGLNEGVFNQGGPLGIGGGLMTKRGGVGDTKFGFGIGGGQEAFKNNFEKTFGAKLDMGNKPWNDIKAGQNAPRSAEEFLKKAMMSGDSKLGTFYDKFNLADVSGMGGDERKDAVNKNMKAFSKDYLAVAGGGYTARDKKYDEVSSTMGGKALADSFLGKDGEVADLGGALKKSKENVGNASMQYEAIVEQLGNMADKGDNLVTIQEKLRQTAAVLGNTDEGDFARATRQYAAGRAGQKMSMEDPFTQANYAVDQFRSLSATPTAQRDDAWATDIQAGQQQLDAIETQMDGVLKNLVLQSREFNIQQNQAVESFGISRARSEEDFQRQRARGEEDFRRGVSRAETDFQLQRRQGREDFNLSRVRQEQDFNHQVEMMAESSAKSIYNIYDRVAVQRTQSAQNIMVTGADQVARMQKQAQDLDKLRGAGLSDDSIQQMSLGDAANAQQAGRLVSEIGDSPEIVDQLNKQVKARLAAAKKLVTDDSSTEWEEMNRSYKLNRERGEDDFDKQMKRSRTSFNLQLKRQRDDFGRSMDYQADDFGRSMGRMASDFERSQNQAKAAMDRSITDMSKSGEDLLKEAGGQMDTVATAQKDKVLGLLETIRAESSKIYSGMKKDFEDVFGNGAASGAKAGGQAGDSKRKKTWFEKNAPKLDGQGGDMGGGDHEHSAGCGHGGSMLPAVLSGSGGIGGPTSEVPASSGPKWGDGKQSKGEAWQKPINAALGSPYGMRRHPVSGVVKLHDGNDFPAPMGTPYGAAGDGVVRTTARTAWGGNVPYIDHGNGIQTFYGHSSSISVSPGQKVKRGQIVGKVGTVGYSTGPHLHFGALREGRPFNSLELLGGAGAGKLTGSGKSVPGQEGSEAAPPKDIHLEKSYEKLEAAAAKMSGAFSIGPGVLSGRINAKAEQQAKKWGADVSYGGDVNTWYGNGAILNAATAIGGGSGAGERGSELVLPLNDQGVGFLHNLLDRMSVGMGSNAVGGQQIVNNNTYSTKIDKSTTFTGAITVQANDANEFLATLRAQQRQAALVNPTLAVAR